MSFISKRFHQTVDKILCSSGETVQKVRNCRELVGARASLPARCASNDQVFADWKSALQLTFGTVSGGSPAWLLLALILFACGCTSQQRYQHFQTATPIGESDHLVLGFLGGRERWDSPREGVRKLALELRSQTIAGLHVETVENVRRDLALELVRNALDRNQDRKLSNEEKASARLILYGQSFGGAAVVKFANQLNELNIPVILTIQIDSVGRGDDLIPENVRFAANLFQRNGIVIRGEPVIRTKSSKTRIIGNFEYDYKNKAIDLSGVPWYKKLFRKSHTKMNLDPDVWNRVKQLIVEIASKDELPNHQEH